MPLNDEPTLTDSLNHAAQVEQVARSIATTRAPFVLAVSGSWGGGKTSFMRKLHARFGGECVDPGDDQERAAHADACRWIDQVQERGDLSDQERRDWHAVWFNPWQYQFESSPMVALLQHIQRHLSVDKRALEEIAKIGDTTVRVLLDLLPELGKIFKLPIPLPSGSKVQERGEAWEAAHFQQILPSQKFRQYYEAVIKMVTGPRGRLVVFIDDLDRCEADTAYRLLEALKLHLNAENCIYVLGIDAEHLEQAVARVLGGNTTGDADRAMARSYLAKMFQLRHTLPAPLDIRGYAESLLEPEWTLLRPLLVRRFGYPQAGMQPLLELLNRNLPHNPRRVKAFLKAFPLLIRMLAEHRPDNPLDWRVVIVLLYLGQFEEQLYRKLEETPAFFRAEIEPFCGTGVVRRVEFAGLELPYGDIQDGSSGESAEAALERRRVFWLAPLVRELRNLDPEVVRRHLLGHPVLSPAPKES
jgi:hypothetical protein